MYKNKLKDYLPQFFESIKVQLELDDARWGDTWKRRSRDGQELRVKARFDDYFDQFQNAGIPVPWMKIVGEALIAWVRDIEALQTDEKRDKEEL